MFSDFQLTAIVKDGAGSRLLRIPLQQDLQRSLARGWEEQYEAFVHDVAEIEFDAGYTPEDGECFLLRGYALPDWMSGETTQSIPDLDSLSRDDTILEAIRSIAAFVRTERGEELILFQSFSRSHVIRPGRFLFLQHDAYESTNRPGLALNDQLRAAYRPSDATLLFTSFRSVNTFLTLADVYQEASEQQIREVLAHRLLAPENIDVIATEANQWFRKRFALLRDSGVLEAFTARQIQQSARGYDVDIRLSQGKIIFPADKPMAKKLLQFLNEERFLGSITRKLYETNSKRAAV
jgi:hypothetical protein